MNTIEKLYLTYREAEVYTGESSMTLRRAVTERRLRACRPIGQRTVRFYRPDLDEYMQGKGTNATASSTAPAQSPSATAPA